MIDCSALALAFSAPSQTFCFPSRLPAPTPRHFGASAFAATPSQSTEWFLLVCISTMTSHLEGIVVEKLRDALAYKTAKHYAVKPEPELLLTVSENGSNLKVDLSMPNAELRVLKVSRSPSSSPPTSLIVSLVSTNLCFIIRRITC
jgi:hypothetical protein